MIQEKTGDKVFTHFDGLLEYAEYADGVPVFNYSKDNNDNDWHGGTFEDAMNQARTGNPELVKSLFDDIQILEGLLEEGDTDTIRDVTGDYFDVGEVISGEPECWRREEYALQKPVIPVFASFSMSCGIRNKIIKNRGAAIIALVDALEKQGFIVDLHLEASRRYEGVTYYDSIKIKTDPIDLDSMAFILANPLCLRRLNLAVLERILSHSNPPGHGMPMNYDTSKILADKDLSGFYLTCSNNDHFDESNYKNLNAAKDHIIKMMESFRENPNQIIIG